MDTARSPTNVRLVPDLGDELLLAFERPEALLGAWLSGRPRTTSGYQPPSPTGGHWAPCRPCEAWCGPPKDATDRSSFRPTAPSRLDRPPDAAALRAATRRPLATLQHAVQILTVRRAYHDLNAAVEQYTAVVREPPLTLVSCLSRTVSLLTLPWDDDVKTLWEAATAHPDNATPSSAAASSKPTTASSGASTISGPSGQASTNCLPDAVAAAAGRGNWSRAGIALAAGCTSPSTTPPSATSATSAFDDTFPSACGAVNRACAGVTGRLVRARRTTTTAGMPGQDGKSDAAATITLDLDCTGRWVARLLPPPVRALAKDGARVQ